jgi:plasmid stability protein
MRQILIRGLSERTVQRLKRRARSRGRSLQQEVKAILDREAEILAPGEAYTRASRWLDEMRRAHGVFSDSAALIREDRDSR